MTCQDSLPIKRETPPHLKLLYHLWWNGARDAPRWSGISGALRTVEPNTRRATIISNMQNMPARGQPNLWRLARLVVCTAAVNMYTHYTYLQTTSCAVDVSRKRVRGSTCSPKISDFGKNVFLFHSSITIKQSRLTGIGFIFTPQGVDIDFFLSKFTLQY